jgi:hypothetical protein
MPSLQEVCINSLDGILVGDEGMDFALFLSAAAKLGNFIPADTQLTIVAPSSMYLFGCKRIAAEMCFGRSTKNIWIFWKHMCLSALVRGL